MAKIVHFPEKKDNLVKQLEVIMEKAEAGEIKRFVFAAELSKYERPEDDRTIVATSHYNADVGDRQYLVAHLQADITAAIVEVNFFEE